jgi:hypothetical protein
MWYPPVLLSSRDSGSPASVSICRTSRASGFGDAITGIDGHNVSLLIRSVRHAAGQRQF